jgi:hypothetical protein
MKIGELAGRVGLKASAIRYYEKMGILDAPHRTGGQRHNPSDALDRVLCLAALQVCSGRLHSTLSDRGERWFVWQRGCDAEEPLQQLFPRFARQSSKRRETTGLK